MEFTGPSSVRGRGANTALFGKKYACSGCGAKFKSEGELKEHSKVHMASMAPGHSQGGGGGNFKCGGCGASFASESDLKAHSAKMHGM